MEHSAQRIKIAVQKKGRLTDHSIDLLERCGLKVTKSKDQLICYGENMPIDLLLVRDDDIPGLVGDDVCDLGIVGLNIVEEKRLALEQNGASGQFKQIFELEFGHCRLSIAAPDGRELQRVMSVYSETTLILKTSMQNRFISRAQSK